PDLRLADTLRAEGVALARARDEGLAQHQGGKPRAPPVVEGAVGAHPEAEQVEAPRAQARTELRRPPLEVCNLQVGVPELLLPERCRGGYHGPLDGDGHEHAQEQTRDERGHEEARVLPGMGCGVDKWGHAKPPTTPETSPRHGR